MWKDVDGIIVDFKWDMVDIKFDIHRLQTVMDGLHHKDMGNDSKESITVDD